jgi:hypothetical protein
MRDPNLKALTVYVDKNVYAAVVRRAAAEERSVAKYLARLIAASPFVIEEMSSAESERSLGFKPSNQARASRQVDLEDAIIAAVKRGPLKASKHK